MGITLRNREQIGASFPLIISPAYVRGSYRWLLDHDSKIENNLPGTQGLEFYELFAIDGSRKGTQQKLCAPWFQNYTTDDLCSVPIHTMAAGFKQEYKALPCVANYLRKEVRCNSSHPDLGCVCGTASCYAPNLWVEGKGKGARDRLSVAHAMLDVSIINNKKGIFERKYLYLPVARCYEFVGNKLHFETNLDLGPQDKPLMVFVPKSDGSGWLTHQLEHKRYHRTQHGIYEHLARHLRLLGLDMFPQVPENVTLPAAPAAPAAPAQPATLRTAASTAGERPASKSAATKGRHKGDVAVAGRAAVAGPARKPAAAAADPACKPAAAVADPARKPAAAAADAARKPAAAVAVAVAAPPAAAADDAAAEPPSKVARRSSASSPRSPRAVAGAAEVISKVNSRVEKPAAPPAAPAAAGKPRCLAVAVSHKSPTAAGACAPQAVKLLQEALKPSWTAVGTAETAGKAAEKAVQGEAAVRPVTGDRGVQVGRAENAGKATLLASTREAMDAATSSESGVRPCASGTAARQLSAASSEPTTDCWAVLSAMLQPTLAAQETVFSSAQHSHHQLPQQQHHQQVCRV